MKLCLFSVSTLYVMHSNGHQRAHSDTFVGVAFFVFVAVTMYHACLEADRQQMVEAHTKTEMAEVLHLKE